MTRSVASSPGVMITMDPLVQTLLEALEAFNRNDLALIAGCNDGHSKRAPIAAHAWGRRLRSMSAITAPATTISPATTGMAR